MATTLLPVTESMIDPAWSDYRQLATSGHGLELRVDLDAPIERWIARSGCGAAVRFEGRRAELRKRGGVAVRSCVLSTDGSTIAMSRDLDGHVWIKVKCTECAKWKTCERVYDGGKHDSKRHQCGAKCRNATGPACDCKCRGQFHGCGS